MDQRGHDGAQDWLRLRLDRARRRAEGATRGSPEWDAAMAELEDVRGQLDEFVRLHAARLKQAATA